MAKSRDRGRREEKKKKKLPKAAAPPLGNPTFTPRREPGMPGSAGAPSE